MAINKSYNHKTQSNFRSFVRLRFRVSPPIAVVVPLFQSIRRMLNIWTLLVSITVRYRKSFKFRNTLFTALGTLYGQSAHINEATLSIRVKIAIRRSPSLRFYWLRTRFISWWKRVTCIRICDMFCSQYSRTGHWVLRRLLRLCPNPKCIFVCPFGTVVSFFHFNFDNASKLVCGVGEISFVYLRGAPTVETQTMCEPLGHTKRGRRATNQTT